MKKSILALCLSLVILLAGLAHAAPVPADIDMVILNGMPIGANADNRVSIERDGSFNILMSVTATEDVKNVHVRAEIFGYEYGDYDLIGYATHNEDLEVNTTYPMTFNVDLPDDMEVDVYKLRVTITNRDDDEVVQNYNIKVDAQRHSMKIRDVLLYPGEEVKSGSALLTSVRVENLGQEDEENVKVRVSVPELGLAGTTYINEINDDDEEGTEEIYMRVPTCAEPGEYDLKIEVFFDRGHERVSETRTLTVLEDDRCNVVAEPVVEETDDAPVETEAVITVVNNAPAKPSTLGKLRDALEIALLVLVGILVVIGLVIGFTKLRCCDEE